MITTIKLTEKCRIESTIHACGRTFVVVCNDGVTGKYPSFEVGVKLLGINEVEVTHTCETRSHAIRLASEAAIQWLEK